MLRGVFVGLLYVLLLCLQQEAYRHGLEHLRSELAQAHQRTLQLPAEPCDECALLAGAAHAVAGASAPLASPAPDYVVSRPRDTSFAPVPGRYYAARAPPAQA